MEIKKLLKQLVSIPSTYPHEANIQNCIEDLLTNEGVSYVKQKVEDSRCNIVAQKGRGNKTISLYAHLDTVPVTDGWKTDPYKLTIQGDSAYGLGTYDMKGGMSVAIKTFLEYEPKHIKTQLLLCVDEENISKGGHTFMQSLLSKNLSCVISTEPAFMHGINGIVIGRSGRAVYVVTLRTKPEHFMFYQPTIDIALHASKLIQKLQKLQIDKGNGMRQFLFVRKIVTEAKGMSTPDTITLEIDAAILPPATNESILKRIQSIMLNILPSCITGTVEYYKRPTPFLSPYSLKQNDAYLNALSQAVAEVAGTKAVPYFRSSVADENIFGAAGISTLGIGPVGGNAHSPNEWVSLSSLEKLYQILNNFLVKVDILH